MWSILLCSYTNPLQSTDAREEVRQIKHSELRAAVTAGEERTVRVLLEALGRERQIIVNMAPAGANTLLFMWV